MRHAQSADFLSLWQVLATITIWVVGFIAYRVITKKED